LAAIAASLVLSAASVATAAQQRVGDWLVDAEADRFSEEKTTVVALTIADDGALAVRCLRGELSLALLGKYRTGDLFVVKFRADRNAVIETVAKAISDDVMEIVTMPRMVRQMLSAREYAFRVMGAAASRDMIFRAGRGAPKAIGAVTKACPLD